MTSAPVVSHALATRVAHAGLASAVVVDLLTGIIEQPPTPSYPENVFYAVHLISGWCALVLALAFWAIILVRRIGTDPGLLMPWFNRRRLRAFVLDLKAQMASLLANRLPPYQKASPLAGALHGLGLLLISATAASGLIYEIAQGTGGAENHLLPLAKDLHDALGGMVWVYLLGHGLMSLIRHYGLDKSLREMWSFGHHD